MLPLYFIKHIFVSTSEDNSASCWFFTSVEENEVIISNCFFNDFITLTKAWGIENFFTLGGGHSWNYCCSSQFGNSLKISFSTLLKPMHPASTRYLEAKSSIPILVRMTFAPASRIFFLLFKTLHSCCLIF